MLRFIYLLTLASLITGCSEDPTQVSGGEDFPNTLASLESQIAFAKDANKDISLNPQGLSIKSDFATGNGLGQERLESTPWVDQDSAIVYSDTTAGFVHFTKTQTYQDLTRKDTLSFIYNQETKDILDGKSTKSLTDYTTRAATHLSNQDGQSWMQSIVDQDGDQLITVKPNRVLLKQVLTYNQGVSISELILEPGDDLNFDTESDNILLEGKTYTRINDVTIDSTHFYPEASQDAIKSPDLKEGLFHQYKISRINNCLIEENSTFHFFNFDTDTAIPVSHHFDSNCGDTTFTRTLDSIEVLDNKYTNSTINETLIVANDTISEHFLEIRIGHQAPNILLDKFTSKQNQLNNDSEKFTLTLTPTPAIDINQEVKIADVEIQFIQDQKEFEFVGTWRQGEIEGYLSHNNQTRFYSK